MAAWVSVMLFIPVMPKTPLLCWNVLILHSTTSNQAVVAVFRCSARACSMSLEESARQLILARQLIRDNSIFPFYQPKVRLKDKKAGWLWSTVTVGMMNMVMFSCPPGIYKSFQDYDLATRISEKMQTSVFQDIAQWLKQGTDVLPVSINAAPVEFLRDNYAETLLKRMQFYKIPPELIEIEITELSLAEGGASYVIRALNLLKKAGLRISTGWLWNRTFISDPSERLSCGLSENRPQFCGRYAEWPFDSCHCPCHQSAWSWHVIGYSSGRYWSHWTAEHPDRLWLSYWAGLLFLSTDVIFRCSATAAKKLNQALFIQFHLRPVCDKVFTYFFLQYLILCTWSVPVWLDNLSVMTVKVIIMSRFNGWFSREKS